MDRNEAKELAKGRLGEYLSLIGVDVDRARHFKANCPLCGSGTHEHGTGAFSFYEQTASWYCHSCRQGGDVFALHGLLNGIGRNSGEAFDGVYDALGISVDGKMSGTRPRGFKKVALSKPEREVSASRRDQEPPTVENWTALPQGHGEREADFSSSEEAKRYWCGRGFTLEQAATWHIGFDSGRGNLLIPLNRGGCVRRSVRSDFKGNTEGCKPTPFNRAVLLDASDARPVFVVEGWADALSINACGGVAIALNGGRNWGYLLDCADIIKANGKRFILSLDHGEGERKKGELFEEELAQALDKAGIEYARINVAGDGKDANDALKADRDGLAARVADAYKTFDTLQDERRQMETEELERYRDGESLAGFADRFYKDITDTAGRFYDTGFPLLNKAISGFSEGGLYSGVYLLGALPSLGKTDFALNIANNLAAGGNDVLYFSLEMSKSELVARSLARLNFDETRAGLNVDCAPGVISQMCLTQQNIQRVGSTRQIEKRIGREILPADTEAKIKGLCDRYFSSIGRRLFVVEGIMDSRLDIAAIEKRVEAHHRTTGNAPVVFIDYLQILTAQEDGANGASDKTLTDEKIKAFKRISKTLDVPVFVISSLNREGYYKKIDITGFKESGGLEFTADVVLGMQYEAVRKIDTKSADKGTEIRAANDEENGKDIRLLDVKVLKNRSGGRSNSGVYTFVAPQHKFIESERGAGILSPASSSDADRPTPTFNSTRSGRRHQQGNLPIGGEEAEG